MNNHGAKMEWTPIGHIRVIDGDTVAFDGMFTKRTTVFGVGLFIRPAKIRMARINAPELKTDPLPAYRSRDELSMRLGLYSDPSGIHNDITILTDGDAADKYGGRMDGEIMAGGVNLSDWMLSQGYAKPMK